MGGELPGAGAVRGELDRCTLVVGGAQNLAGVGVDRCSDQRMRELDRPARRDDRLTCERVSMARDRRVLVGPLTTQMPSRTHVQCCNMPGAADSAGKPILSSQLHPP